MTNYNYPLYPSVTFDPRKDKVYALTTDFDLAPGATKSLLILVDDEFMRLIDQKINFLNGELDMKVVQGANVTANGTQTFSGCVDLNITQPSMVMTYEDPTFTGGFALLGLAHFGIPNDIANFEIQAPQTVAAVTMKRNTNYVYTFTNVSSETITNAQFLIVWIE